MPSIPGESRATPEKMLEVLVLLPAPGAGPGVNEARGVLAPGMYEAVTPSKAQKARMVRGDTAQIAVGERPINMGEAQKWKGRRGRGGLIACLDA